MLQWIVSPTCAWMPMRLTNGWPGLGTGAKEDPVWADEKPRKVFEWNNMRCNIATGQDHSALQSSRRATGGGRWASKERGINVGETGACSAIVWTWQARPPGLDARDLVLLFCLILSFPTPNLSTTF